MSEREGWHPCNYCDGYILPEDSYYYWGDGIDDDDVRHPMCWDCLMDSKSKILEKHWCDRYCCEEKKQERDLSDA